MRLRIFLVEYALSQKYYTKLIKYPRRVMVGFLSVVDFVLKDCNDPV
jgi:hypothetical protein